MGTEIWCLVGSNLAMAALLIWQQVFFTKQIQLMINKLMSRDYADYERVATPAPPRPIIVPSEAPEDFRPLQEFNLGF